MTHSRRKQRAVTAAIERANSQQREPIFDVPALPSATNEITVQMAEQTVPILVAIAPLMDSSELAAFLKVSEATVARLVQEGLPQVRIGKRAVRYDPLVVRSWIINHYS
jgi:hypothetical protein